MKTKKQLLIIFILLTSILVNFGYASWSDNTLPVEELYDVVSCSNSSKLYLDEDNDSDSLSDMFFYLNSNFTLVGEKEQSYTAGQIMREMNGTIYTKVKYYTPLQNMFYKISNTNQTGDIDNYTFWRASRVFPYNTAVRGIATTPNKVVFEQPTDNDNEKNIISIVYNYKYKYAIDFDGNSTSAYWYNQIPDMSYVGNNYVTFYEILPGNYGNRKRSWSSIRELETCRNYELNRCGDGKTDEYDTSWTNEFESELCDDGPNNGQPGYCDISCGRSGSIPKCGDNILQEPGSTPYDSDNDGIDDGESWEECDDGDDPNDLLPDGDGAINTETIGEGGFCSTICLYHFVEAFVEVFINE